MNEPTIFDTLTAAYRDAVKSISTLTPEELTALEKIFYPHGARSQVPAIVKGACERCGKVSSDVHRRGNNYSHCDRCAGPPMWLDVDEMQAQRDEALARIDKAQEVIIRFGGIDGDHHKAWVIDQAFRHLAGKDYEKMVAEAKDGENGPNTYSWNEGISP